MIGERRRGKVDMEKVMGGRVSRSFKEKLVLKERICVTLSAGDLQLLMKVNNNGRTHVQRCSV